LGFPERFPLMAETNSATDCLMIEDFPAEFDSKIYLLRAILEATEGRFRLMDGYDDSLITVSLPELEMTVHASTSFSDSAFICPICLGLPRHPVFLRDVDKRYVRVAFALW